MRLLWLSNMTPGPVKEALGGKNADGLWMDHVLRDLRKQQDLKIRLLCAADREEEGRLDENCSFSLFPIGSFTEENPALSQKFVEQLREFQPDVVHIWGTEFPHTLSMLKACRQEDLLDHTVVSIQGLCSFIAEHYNEGIPPETVRHSTLRDFLRQDNLLQQQKAFLKRGENEQAALALARHVIGRTHWDRACTAQLNPEAQYHFCNETLREGFYSGAWQYETCSKHRIFASSCLYPVKGFHYLLKAFDQVKKNCGDAVLSVPGESPVAVGLKERLRQDGYKRYLSSLLRQYDLESSVEFLGSLTEENMKEAYLNANVFVLPSTIENSSNSLGEAMLLGVPTVAADVGGVTSMLENGREGIVYQGTAPYMLADAILQVFRMEKQAETMGKAAAAHAAVTHDPKTNFSALLGIYDAVRKKGEA